MRCSPSISRNGRLIKNQVATHSLIGFVSVAVAFGAAVIHLWAGWEDEHRVVLQPVRHLTILAAMAWVLSLAVSLLVVVFSQRGRKMALGALGLNIVGLLLLFTR